MTREPTDADSAVGLMTEEEPSADSERANDDLRALYTEYHGQLLRWVHRMTGDPDLAEDIAQEALIRLVETGGSDRPRNTRAWLFQVARNRVRDVARRQETARRLTPPPETVTAATPETDLVRGETIREVREALDRLSPRDRELLIMRESGFRYREIAEVIGVKTESVPTLAMRALARFRIAYEGRSR
jgi:RNA polymerase sigma-70 factor (ECF subfamily)